MYFQFSQVSKDPWNSYKVNPCSVLSFRLSNFIASTGFSFQISLTHCLTLQSLQFLLLNLSISNSCMWNRITCFPSSHLTRTLYARLSSQIDHKERMVHICTWQMGPVFFFFFLAKLVQCVKKRTLLPELICLTLLKILRLYCLFWRKLSFNLIFLKVAHPSLMVALISCKVRMKYAMSCGNNLFQGWNQIKRKKV